MRVSAFSHERRGMALVIVLAFVVLLTGLVLAFFVRATSYRVESSSSVHVFRAETLGRSALDVVVSDLKREIVHGSNPMEVGQTTLHVPRTNFDAVPVRSGNPAPVDGVDPVPNLIRRSVRAEGAIAPALPSRASAASSETPALNGPYVSRARWNKHYLVPRDPALYGGANAGIIGTDPVPAFEVPDWVYVTDEGPEVLAASDRSVLGRYAFAIYDEGGLLDINAAGSPSGIPVLSAHPGPDPHGLENWGTGAKGALAFADLTAIGLAQEQSDAIVGWRTYATSQPSGQLPDLTFDQEAAVRFHDFALVNDTGFLTVPPTTATFGSGTVTDQIFTSRQQLLDFRRNFGLPQDALQYLGTFSRDLEQPSFVPNPNRPTVQASATTNAIPYGTGNNAHGVDREADPAEDINPPFPAVRVTGEFQREDGTTAVLGEVLVKKRFPLSRLGMLSRNATASKSDTDPIYRSFGLHRSDASEPWQYDHGNPTGILRLDAVAAAGREPDFFELLQAAINVGSLGKGSAMGGGSPWTTDGSDDYLQHRGLDTLINLQVLQIGANILDQYDGDGYPTAIAFAGDADREVRGVENLPYLNRIRLRFARSNIPADGVQNPGSLVLNPEIWNPHGSEPPADAPGRFRIRAINTLGASAPSACRLVYKSGETLEHTVDWSAGGALTFETDGSLYREPTVLVSPGVPSGSALSGPQRTDSLAAPPQDIVGLVAVDFTCVHNGSEIDKGYLGQPDHGPVTLILEYFDGSDYRAYDEQTFEWTGSSFTPKGTWADYSAKIKYDGGARTDPRTSRWGMATMELFYLLDAIDPANHVFASQWPTTAQPPYGPKASVPGDKGFLNAFSNYVNDDNPPDSTSKYRGFTQGYWSVNTVRNQKGYFGMEDKPFYNRDPDGIVRRAMGGYASDPDSGGDFANTGGLPTMTGNFASRPIVLNRPFRSVAELGYTFRGTPWKNLDFSFPESGDAALLDVFCIEEPATEGALVAGKVNLNTRQAPVLEAMLRGALVDRAASPASVLDASVARSLAERLVARTSSTDPDLGPLANRSELVGRWKGTGATPATPSGADPSEYYSGFSEEIGTATDMSGTPLAFIPAQRDSVMRALVDPGTTRVWNVLVDLVAQSGRFPRDGGSLDDFVVEGEKRYWLHVAIDRLTGEVIDRQLEVVTE